MEPEQTAKETVLPNPLVVNFDSIPKRLQDADQFVVWKYAIVDDEIKKPPFSPKTGRAASIRTPSTWGSFEEARAAYASGQFAGIGIVLTQSLGIVGIDIDHCIVAGQ